MADIQERDPSRHLSVFNRLTIGELKKAWDGLKSAAKLRFGGAEGTQVRVAKDERIAAAIRECIDAKGGDVSARAHTVELGTLYLNLSEAERRIFHETLARDFDTDGELLRTRLQVWQGAQTREDRTRAEIALKEALVPPRARLLKQFASLPNGLKFLIDMRAALQAQAKEDPGLYKLSLDLKEILASWFDVGLLDLREITWESSAALLEKLIAYEAVHKIASWDDLRKRLASDRLCFAFFHNKMPGEPLIFVEVALVDKMSDNIAVLLETEAQETDTPRPTTAIFYSITNTQPGLSGIHLGNFLIKTVVEKLSRERRTLKHFATLSPVPGLRGWLEPRLVKGEEGLLTTDERHTIQEHCDDGNVALRLQEVLAGPWHADPAAAAWLKPILLRLCARYLAAGGTAGRSLDPVAHFHLNNGARLERINWLANVSETGIEGSYGIMVNYYYKLSDIEKNHEGYVAKRKIALGREVRALLKKGE